MNTDNKSNQILKILKKTKGAGIVYTYTRKDAREFAQWLQSEGIKAGFYHLLDSLDIKHEKNSKITESWLQYYEPTSGRGHNAHNHCRWHHSEAKPIMFSGGYYLSDGEPIKDHPYSGVFAFHIRGMKYYIRPKKGMLLIWPYDIIHSVEPFYGKKHRAVINFNIQI